jgi:GNAT superfamily N-acetyltransferase
MRQAWSHSFALNLHRNAQKRLEVSDHWGRDIGVALVSAARTRLRDLGFRRAILWLLAGNVRAERFYVMDHWNQMGYGGERTVRY